MQRQFAAALFAGAIGLTTVVGANDAKRIDVAAVISKADAEATLGEPVKDPEPRNGEGADGFYSRCNYYTQSPGKSLVLRVHNAAAGVDTKQEFKQLSGASGKSKSIDNLGDRASLFTGGPQAGLSHVMMLYVAKGNAVITIGIGGIDDENVALEKAKEIAQKILKQL